MKPHGFPVQGISGVFLIEKKNVAKIPNLKLP
jgi:hypothetical protein